MSKNEEEKYQDSEEQPLKDDENKTKFEDKSFYQKLCHIKSQISVEPIFAGLVIPAMLSKLAVQHLNLDKSCRVKLEYGNEICDALMHKAENMTYYEGEVQKVISNIETWKSIVQTSLPTLLVIFMGAWSDRTGNRKLCILLPILGEFLVCVSNAFSTFFFYEVSIETTMFFEAFFPAITGGWVMVYLGVFSYISDITDEESRTFRMGLVNLCLTAGIPVGTALSGILLKVLGYYSVFGISGMISLITLCYGFFYLKSRTKPGISDTEKAEPIKISDLVSLVKETASVAIKKREGNTKKKIILTLIIVAIVYGPNHGERMVTYMFVRYRLKWDAVKYSMYSTYSIIVHSFGALFTISVFSKRWGFHDSMLCLISVGSKLMGSVLIAFVRTDFDMFMVPLVEILNATTFTSLRSMISKLVRSEEMGKMNSLFSLVETLGALMFEPTYAAMYANTLAVFTGTVYLFSAMMTLPPIGMLIWIFVQHRLEVKQKKLWSGGKEEKNQSIEEGQLMSETEKCEPSKEKNFKKREEKCESIEKKKFKGKDVKSEPFEEHKLKESVKKSK